MDLTYFDLHLHQNHQRLKVEREDVCISRVKMKNDNHFNSRKAIHWVSVSSLAKTDRF